MGGPHLRSTGKSVVAILCAACFLTMSLGAVSRGFAADNWETWPKKTTVPGEAPNPETDAVEVAKTGEAAGKKTSKGSSSGTIWWITAGTAVLIGIGIAIAGGGGGSDGSTTNPGHQ
jgi:hypothetical protein